MFSAEDSLANPTQVPEIDLERKMSDTSGRKCLEQLGKFSQVGLWAKTFADLLIGMEGWYSMKCSLTWKLKATKSSRFYFQLVPLMLPIEETEFGLLPTVSTTDWNTPFTKIQKEKYLKRRHKEGKMAYPISFNQLRQIAYEQLLPTPTCQDAKQKENSPSQQHKVSELAIRVAGGSGFQLNPQFVIEMMGFPTDWTLLPFLNGETSQSKQEATQ